VKKLNKKSACLIDADMFVVWVEEGLEELFVELTQMCNLGFKFNAWLYFC